MLVIAGAVVGAPLRYLTDRAVQARHDTVFPWGTFTVNVVGCLVLAATLPLVAVLAGLAVLAVGTAGRAVALRRRTTRQLH